MALYETQLLLPFAEKEYVDVKRAKTILSCSAWTIHQLHAVRRIKMIDYAPNKRKRVLYQSLVDFCDSLRQKYCIRDRRPALEASFLRHKDCDLLPFPITDTISVNDVMPVLGYSTESPIYLMIEEGRFDAYRLTSLAPWRISLISLTSYLQTVPNFDGNFRHSSSL